MHSDGKKIVSHGSIYLLGNILRYSISFIMLPIYTRFLTPEDYGIIELLTMTLDFVGLLLSVRVGQSIYRYFYKYYSDSDKKQIIFSSYVLSLISGTIALLVIIIFSDYISAIVFGDENYKYLLQIFSLSLLFNSMIETPLVMYRVQQKPWIYTAFSLAKLTIALSLNIYFVVYKKLHVEGVIYSTLITNFALSLVLTFFLIKYAGFSFSISKSKELLNFSFPYIMVGSLSFYLNFGDRYFLRFYQGGFDEIGIYSLGYKFGFLLMFLVGQPFADIWDSQKFRIYKERDNPAIIYNKIFLFYSALVSIVVLGLSLFGRNAITIMATRDFWPASEIIPIVCMAYAFNCLEGYVNLGLLIAEKTLKLSFGTVLAAIVATLGYYFLIPKFGATGAAWASLLAFATRMVWNLIQSKKYFNMELEWVRVVVMWSIMLIVMAVSIYLQPKNVYFAVLVNIFAIFLTFHLYIYLPLFPADVRMEMKIISKDPLAVIRIIKNKVFKY